MVTTATNWFIPFNPQPKPALRLFCFANAGGSTGQFRSWGAMLPASVEVCAVQLPGQGMRMRETPYTRTAPLAKDLADNIEPLLTVPFALFGYSVGGLIAYELARELRRRDHLAAHLFIAARRAPHLPVTSSPIHHLPDTAFIEALQHRYNGIPATILQEPDMLALFLPVLRKNFELLETYAYVPDRPLDCPISAFGGHQDLTVNADQIAAWEEHTTSRFSSQMFSGGHFFLQDHLDAVLQTMNSDLSRLLDSKDGEG